MPIIIEASDKRYGHEHNKPVRYCVYNAGDTRHQQSLHSRCKLSAAPSLTPSLYFFNLIGDGVFVFKSRGVYVDSPRHCRVDRAERFEVILERRFRYLAGM